MRRQPTSQGVDIAGEVQLGDDNFVTPRVAEIQRAEEDAVGDAGVLMHEHGILRRAHQGGDLVSDGLGQFEPAAAPSGDALLRPGVGVEGQAVVDTARHGAE